MLLGGGEGRAVTMGSAPMKGVQTWNRRKSMRRVKA
jgi:hypothetical protein